MRILIVGLLLACISVSNGASVVKQPPSYSTLDPAVEELFTVYWNWRLYDHPEYASFVGIHDYDNILDDLSLDAYQSRYDTCYSFLIQATALEGTLTEHADLLNIKVFKDEVSAYIGGFQFKGYYLPINFLEGIQRDFERLITWMILDTAEDYNKLLSRYELLPSQIAQIIILMKKGMEEGIVNHQISMKYVAEKLDEMAVEDPRTSTLYTPFINFPDGIDSDQATEFQIRAQQILDRNIIPAFARLRDFIRDDYVTRPDIAITSLPNGPKMYEQLLRFHTSTTLTVQQIHDLGLSEVKRIEKEMAKIIAELGYNMTVPEFSDMIKNDPNNFYDNPDDLLAGFEDICFNQVPDKLDVLFKNIPISELVIEGDMSPDGAGAYYLGPSYDGIRPGVFYVNIYNYDAQPKYGMMTLSLHEARPGHHLQNSHSVESPNIPFFRRVMEDRNYGTAPSRFPMNTAYAEGWGLYAESLGFDMNLYEDLYDRYGHYSDEIFRACRLVVDTGMHALGWTKEEAIDFVDIHTALSKVEIKNEIDRYITWPGQALAYKIGELKFQELKLKAMDQMEDRFDIKDFHDIILDSVGPLSIVEEEINSWMEGAKK